MPTTKHNQKIALSLILIFFLTFLPQVSENIYTPSLSDLSIFFNSSPSQVERTVGIYFFGFAAGVLFWGTISDKIGRRFSIIYGLILYILGSLLCVLSKDIEFFFLGRIIQAFGASVGSVVVQTMVRDCYDEKERSKIFTKIVVYLSLAPALGPILGGFLTKYLTWHANFVFLIIFAFCLLFWSIKSLPETLDATQKKSINIRHYTAILVHMLTSKRIICSVILVGTFNGLLFSFYAEGPFIYIDNLGMEPEQYGSLGLIFALSGIMGGKISKSLLNKQNPNETLKRITLYFCIISVALYAIIRINHFDVVISAILIIVMMMMLFFTFSIVIPRILSLALIDYKQSLGTASALFGFLYYVVVYIQVEIIALIHTGKIDIFPVYFTLLTIIIFLTSRVLPSKC